MARKEKELLLSGDALRRIAKERGLTLGNISVMMLFEKSYLASMLPSGKPGRLSERNAHHLALILQCEVDDLLYKEEKKTEPPTNGLAKAISNIGAELSGILRQIAEVTDGVKQITIRLNAFGNLLMDLKKSHDDTDKKVSDIIDTLNEVKERGVQCANKCIITSRQQKEMGEKVDALAEKVDALSASMSAGNASVALPEVEVDSVVYAKAFLKAMFKSSSFELEDVLFECASQLRISPENLKLARDELGLMVGRRRLSKKDRPFTVWCKAK